MLLLLVLRTKKKFEFFQFLATESNICFTPPEIKMLILWVERRKAEKHRSLSLPFVARSKLLAKEQVQGGNLQQIHSACRAVFYVLLFSTRIKLCVKPKGIVAESPMFRRPIRGKPLLVVVDKLPTGKTFLAICGATSAQSKTERMCHHLSLHSQACAP